MRRGAGVRDDRKAVGFGLAAWALLFTLVVFVDLAFGTWRKSSLEPIGHWLCLGLAAGFACLCTSVVAVIATRDAMRRSRRAIQWIALALASSLVVAWGAILWFLSPG